MDKNDNAVQQQRSNEYTMEEQMVGGVKSMKSFSLTQMQKKSQKHNWLMQKWTSVRKHERLCTVKDDMQ